MRLALCVCVCLCMCIGIYVLTARLIWLHILFCMFDYCCIASFVHAHCMMHLYESRNIHTTKKKRNVLFFRIAKHRHHNSVRLYIIVYEAAAACSYCVQRNVSGYCCHCCCCLPFFVFLFFFCSCHSGSIWLFYQFTCAIYILIYHCFVG